MGSISKAGQSRNSGQVENIYQSLECGSFRNELSGLVRIILPNPAVHAARSPKELTLFTSLHRKASKVKEKVLKKEEGKKEGRR